MRCALRSLLLSSTLLACAAAAPLAAAQGGQGPADKAGQAGAAQPAAEDKPEAPAGAGQQGGGAAAAEDPPAQSGDPPTSRADLRTFGGTCIRDPIGPNEQIGGGLAAVLIPQLVGAGVDALSSALAAAGQDRPLSQSTVVALENAVTCVQVARDVSTGTGLTGLQNDVKRAPFLVEFFLRQSADGSALLVAPTILNYRETLDRRRTSRRRTLYATLTFTDASGERTSTVTVPLGAYATSLTPYPLDPVRGPFDPNGFSSLGAANSIWIPNPFQQVATPPPPPPPPPQAQNQPARPQQSPQRARQAPGASAGTPFGTGAVPHATPTSPAPDPAAGDGQPPAAPPPRVLPPGARITPVSISVVITEIRPGSAIARALAGVLRGSRAGIVNALDPAQREQARQQEQAAAATAVTALIEAQGHYAEAYQAYCDEPAATRRSKAPALFTAQMKLLDARRGARATDTEPFRTVVDPRFGYGATVDEDFCRAPV